MKKLKIAGLLVATILMSFVTFAGNASAADGATMMKKWVFTQYYDCIRSGYIVPELSQSLRGNSVAVDVFTADGSLAFPSYNFQNTMNGSTVNCRQLFTGLRGGAGSSRLSGITSVMSYAGMSDTSWTSASGVKNFLEKLGYVLDESGEQRFTITARKHTSTTITSVLTNTYESDSDASTVTITAKTENGTTTYTRNGTFDNAVAAIKVELKNHNMRIWLDDGWAIAGCRALYDNQEVTLPLKADVQEFYNDIKNALTNVNWGVTCSSTSMAGVISTSTTSTETYRFGFDDNEVVDAGDTGNYVYAKDQNSYTVSDTAIRNMSGMSITGIMFNNSELYTLYTYYLDKALPGNVSNRINCNPSSTNNLTPVKLKDSDGQFKTCYVNFNGVDPSTIQVYTQTKTDTRMRQPYPFIAQITMQDVINWLNNVDESSLTDTGTIDGMDAGYTEDPNSVQTGSGSDCRGAARSLGWIVCPILDWIGEGVTKLYDNYVKPSLQVEPKLFSNETQGAKQGWDVFRNIANVVIIILFLVVIFSQLTGVGIDNYGIKKILPKLILVAILMNLSYYICEAAVDLSNIAGNGIQAMFDGMASNITISSDYGGGGGATIMSVVLLGGAIAGAAWAGVFSLATLLAFLPTAISVLVAIFFLFILLAAREAAVVVLVVLSPLAFACFILPNTKKIFDKWLKVGEALLIVYPIVGLLVGGGNYVSKLLLATDFAGDSFAKGLTAMLVGIVPVFFIPSLLKSSMAGLGGLGDKISNFGNRLGRGAASRAAGSEAFKNQQQRANERRLRKMAGLKKNENGEWVDSNGLRSRFAKSGVGKALGADRNLARRRSQVEAMEHAREMELGYNDMGVLNAQRVKDENMRVSRAAEGEAGVSALDADVALTQARNARMEQDANMAVGVPALNEDLARQRAQARRSSQELRNYQDQYATFSKAQLSNASKNAFGANGWLRQQDGAQRMAALMGAMINNGMENDVYQLLRDDANGEIAQNASVMQMLAGVKEKGLKAYGKKGIMQDGTTMSYTDFMTRTLPSGKTAMQEYIDDKGNEFYSDLSDKTLKQIAAFDRDFGVQNMSTSQLFSAASRLQAQDAVNVVDEMLVKRAQQAAQAGTPLKFTGDQLASFSPSTVAELNKSAVGQQAIVEASQDLLRNPKLQSKVDAESRQIIDQLRGMAGQSEIWEPGEKIVRQRDASALEGGGSIRQETVVSQEAASARAQQAATAEVRPWTIGTTGINELLNMVGPTKRSSDYGKLEDAILNYSGSDFAITPKQLDDLPASTVQRLASSANITHTQALLAATDGMTAEQFSRLNPTVKETLNSLRVRNGKPRL